MTIGATRFPHLAGRADRLAEDGMLARCGGAAPGWAALVALHGGVFTRRQYLDCVGADRKAAQRFVEALIAAAAGAEDYGGPGIGRFFRLNGKRVYRLLGVPDIRHRRDASRGETLRRLLALDYVLAHPAEPWRPTEGEKVAALQRVGVPREVLPRRVYRGRAGAATTRYFPGKMPVLVGRKSARFVFVDDGEASTMGALQSWGAEHRELWDALVGRGHDVEVVFASRNGRRCERAWKMLRRWSLEAPEGEAAGASSPSPRTGASADAEAAREEVARIAAALKADDRAVLDPLGGAIPAFRRMSTLIRRFPEPAAETPAGVPRRAARACVQVARTGVWLSTRFGIGLDREPEAVLADACGEATAALGGRGADSVRAVASIEVPK